jgi:hypothetical protein
MIFSLIVFDDSLTGGGSSAKLQFTNLRPSPTHAMVNDGSLKSF